MKKSRDQAALKAVLAFIGGELNARIGVFLERAERSLTETWPDIRDPNRQAAAKSAARWLAEHNTALSTALHERLVQALTNQLSPRKPIDSAELEILDERALAVVMIRAKLVSQIMDRARGEVVMLEARLDALKQAGLAVNPRALAPGVIADGFLNVLNELSVPPDVQGVLLEIYGEQGADRFIEFYHGINQLLIGYGILPKAQIYDLKSRHVAREITPTHLARLLDSKLEKMLSVLERIPKNEWRPGTLRELFDEAPKIELTPAQVQSFEHVEAIILDFLRDPRISMRIRGEMGRLLLPLIAVRLADPDRFAAPDNPSRVFVRQLALLGYRDQEHPLQEFDSIRIVVGRVVAEHGQELRSFHTGAMALYTIARNEVRQRLVGATGESSRAQVAGAERPGNLPSAEQARTQVIIELREHTAGLALPDAVRQFVIRLLGPWMMVRFLRYGEGSVPWTEARTFAAVFFDVLRPAVSGIDHTRKCTTRRYALAQTRLRTERSRMPAGEAQALLARIENYFAGLDANPDAGLKAAQAAGAQSGTGFLEALPLMTAEVPQRPLIATNPPAGRTAGPAPAPRWRGTGRAG